MTGAPFLLPRHRLDPPSAPAASRLPLPTLLPLLRRGPTPLSYLAQHEFCLLFYHDVPVCGVHTRPFLVRALRVVASDSLSGCYRVRAHLAGPPGHPLLPVFSSSAD